MSAPLAPAVFGGILAFAALAGLLIGSFLNVVVYRVPAKMSLVPASRCPECSAPVRPWQNVPVVSWLILRGRCASCRAPISRRYPLTEAATALAFVAVTDWVLRTPDLAQGGGIAATVVMLVAYLYLAAISIALTQIDIATHRLPNAIVLPSYVVALTLFALTRGLAPEGWSLLRALLGMVALYLFYLLLHRAIPRGMGGGDVKLAGVLGMYLAWVGWGTFAVGAFAAFLLGGVYGVGMIVLRRARRGTPIPFGPWMIAGAWAGLFCGEFVATWYLSLLGLA